MGCAFVQLCRDFLFVKKAKETEEALSAILHKQTSLDTNTHLTDSTKQGIYSSKFTRLFVLGIVVSEIVAYGHKISYTTSAPPGWVPTQIAVFKPPAPQDENIRMGLLYSTIDSM